MTAFDERRPANATIGYANTMYDLLTEFGLRPEHAVLDVACGNGLASAPLLKAGYDVTGVDASEERLAFARAEFADAHWVVGETGSLPFADAQFDAVISAHALHRVDRASAIAEIARVLRPGGIVGIWWRNFRTGDAVNAQRIAVCEELGATLPPDGLPGGFKEFYATFSSTALRIVPWETVVRLDRFMADQRSQVDLREALGERATSYYEMLEERLRENRLGENPFITLTYTQFLYLAKKEHVTL